MIFGVLDLLRAPPQFFLMLTALFSTLERRTTAIAPVILDSDQPENKAAEGGQCEYDN